jgi:uncharacterized protein (TIGR00297 family)
MGVEDGDGGWRKAIPERRDRLQSRMLVWIAVPALAYLIFWEFRFFLQNYAFEHGRPSLFGLLRGHFLPAQGNYDDRLAQAVGVSVIFALAAWRFRAATAMAALCGGMICLLISVSLNTPYGSSIFHSGLTPLLLLFVLTFEATRLGRERKVLAGVAESRKGRNAAQIIANLGVAAFFSSMIGWYIVSKFGWFGEFMGDDARARAYFSIPYLPMLAALAEATADTVSSEIGQAFGGTPIMLTTLRRVPHGTDGAITLIGTLAGVAAAAIIAATGIPALGMSPAECAVAFAAGVAGLFFDSLLGATVERKGWIGNDLVNFFSTAFAAAVSLVFIRFAQDSLIR